MHFFVHDSRRSVVASRGSSTPVVVRFFTLAAGMSDRDAVYARDIGFSLPFHPDSDALRAYAWFFFLLLLLPTDYCLHAMRAF